MFCWSWSASTSPCTWVENLIFQEKAKNKIGFGKREGVKSFLAFFSLQIEERQSEKYSTVQYRAVHLIAGGTVTQLIISNKSH